MAPDPDTPESLTPRNSRSTKLTFISENAAKPEMNTVVSKHVLSSKYYPATELFSEMKVLFMKIHQYKNCARKHRKEIYCKRPRILRVPGDRGETRSFATFPRKESIFSRLLRSLSISYSKFKNPNQDLLWPVFVFEFVRLGLSQVIPKQIVILILCIPVIFST